MRQHSWIVDRDITVVDHRPDSATDRAERKVSDPPGILHTRHLDEGREHPVTDPIRFADDAVALATRIMAGRRHPLVVVSTDPATGRTALDLDELRDAVGDLAEIVAIRTGALTWRLDALLPDRAQVYGGAGRSYPTDFGDDPDWRRSPLRFPGEHATRQLIDDVLAQAHAAGLFEEHRTSAETATGTVAGIIGSRALVDVDGDGRAAIRAETLFPEYPLEWMLRPGQRVEGTLDRTSGRFLATTVPADAAAIAAHYRHGAVTLALVADTAPTHATLLIHPDVPVTVHLADITTNPFDAIDHLLADGDVVTVRVVHLLTGGIHLRMSDIDDDEPVLDALPLIAGGPPWLAEDRPLTPEPATPPIPEVAHTAATPDAEGLSVTDASAHRVTPPTPIAPVPGPGMRRVDTGEVEVVPGEREVGPRGETEDASNPDTGATPAPGVALRSAQLALHAERARVADLERRLAEYDHSAGDDPAPTTGRPDPTIERLRGQIQSLERRLKEERADRGELYRKNRELHDRVATLTRANRDARKRAPKQTSADRAARRGRWLDARDWIGHEILLAWVDRVEPSERDRWPLGSYTVGDRFVDSLDPLDDGQFAKAMRACVDVITDRVRDLPARNAHVLRRGEGGDDPDTVRSSDGAVCWRVYIEQNTPAARRLHYWVLPDGTIELSRIVTHDDTEP